MKETDFTQASPADREEHIVRPYEQVPPTTLVEGANSHLIAGQQMTLSFLTMEPGSVFELHTHPIEQIMFVLEGYCDEVIADKMYRVRAGDAIYLPANIPHGAFVRDVECRVIDIFSPPRRDYMDKFDEQHPGVDSRFL